MASLNTKVSCLASMLQSSGLVRLEIFSGEYLSLSSSWTIMAARISVSKNMDLVADMTTDLKREVSLKLLGSPYMFFSLF